MSTDDQDLSHQINLCKKYCDINSHDIINVYTDVCSGKNISRPQFDIMMRDLRQYKFNTIMVTKLDRIGRSLAHLLSLFEEFKRKGVQFIAVTQNIDTTTASGVLMLQILGSFAEFERNLISERTKEAIRNNPKVGKRGKDKKPRLKRGGLRVEGKYMGDKDIRF